MIEGLPDQWTVLSIHTRGSAVNGIELEMDRGE
jgi:hypothetical protein